MINESRLLNEANSLFVQKKFEKALFLYSQLSSNFPENKEYKIYALFCDVASEDVQKAMPRQTMSAPVSEQPRRRVLGSSNIDAAKLLYPAMPTKLTPSFTPSRFGVIALITTNV